MIEVGIDKNGHMVSGIQSISHDRCDDVGDLGDFAAVPALCLLLLLLLDLDGPNNAVEDLAFFKSRLRLFDETGTALASWTVLAIGTSSIVGM